MTSTFSETGHAQRELPPELTDRIIDFLHNEPGALATCSLVARSWTPASRYHRFSSVRLISNEDWERFDRLIEISPSMIHYVRGATMDVTSGSSARWLSACTSFTSLEHITMYGVISPPWQSEAAAISSVAHRITSFTLNAALMSRYDFWPIIRMFPSLVSLRPFETIHVAESVSLQLSSLPCYSPSISSISIAIVGQEHVLDNLCNPPYPLTSLTALDIRVVGIKQTHGLQALAKTYAGQITRLRLHVRLRNLHSPDYISRFTNLRHLTFANLYCCRYWWRETGKCDGWVNRVIAAIQSPITHLTFEILVHREADLHAIDWKAIDVLISTRGILRSLVQVSVVFLDRVETQGWDPMSVAHPVTIRRLMPLTAMMGLLNIATRGPKMYPP